MCVCARARVSGADKVISSKVFQNCPDLRCFYSLGYFWAHFFFSLGLVALPLKVTAIPAQGVVRRENEQDLPQGILSPSIAGNALFDSILSASNLKGGKKLLFASRPPPLPLRCPKQGGEARGRL